MYTTLEKVKANLGQFAELITAGMEDSEVSAFITEADDIIDGYIAAAVNLPFSVIPKLISSISTDIAVRNLWAQKQAKSLPEHIKLDYENALKLLTNIAKGTIKLGAKDPEDSSFSDLKHSSAASVWRRNMRRLLEALGLIVSRDVKRRIRAGKVVPSSNNGGTTLVRSAKLVNSIHHIITGEKVDIGSNLVYARIHHEGGTIKPVRAKYLAIPLTKEAAVRRPRDWVKHIYRQRSNLPKYRRWRD